MTRKISWQIALTLLVASVQSLNAQTTSAPDVTASKKDETVVLDPFQVKSSTSENYSSGSATSVGRINQKLEDIPQQVNIYTAAFLRDVQPTLMQDALRFDSAVSINNSLFNGVSAQVRGFDTSVAGILRNGVKITTAGGLGSVIGVEALEQVEVVKGAAGVLYGPSQPGGVINYVTKQPLFNQQTTVGLTFFSEGGYSAMLDTSGPAPIKTADGREVLAYRLVAAHVDQDLYQMNNQEMHRDLLYGALTYKPFPDLTINGNWERDRQKVGFFNSQLLPAAEITALGNFVTGTLKPDQAPLPYDIYPVDWTYQDTNGYLKDKDDMVQLSATLNHDFGRFGRWAFRMNYTWSETSLERLLVDISAANNPRAVTAADIGKVVNFTETVTANDVAAGRLWIPSRYIRKLESYPQATMNTQWDLTGQFDTGPVKHTFLLGSDMSMGTQYNGPTGVVQIERQVYNNASGAANAIWVDHPNLRAITNYNFDDIGTEFVSQGGVTTTNVINPSGTVTKITSLLATTTPQSNLHYFGVPLLTVPDKNNYDKPIYFFDAASLMDGRLQLSAGARYDALAQSVGTSVFKTSRWTYRYGFVAKIRPQFHVFALHSESFNPNSAAASAAFGFYVKPQSGVSDEAGIRLSLLQSRVDLEASVYKITVTDVVQTNPFGNVGVVPPIPANNFTFVPGITNKGFDLNTKVNLANDLQLTGSYTHTDASYAAGPTQLALGVTRFAVNNQPKDQFAVFAKYSLPGEQLKGFSVTAGYNWTGRRPGGAVGALPAFYLNPYGIANVGIGYTRGRWSYNLMVKNVTNVYAFRSAPTATRLYPEEPRQATFSIRAKF